MPNEKMEIFGKAEMNNIVTGNMFKAGVDALANAIQDAPRLLAMLMASALNEYLAKQTKTFTPNSQGKRRKNKTRSNETIHNRRTNTKPNQRHTHYFQGIKIVGSHMFVMLMV